MQDLLEQAVDMWEELGPGFVYWLACDTLDTYADPTVILEPVTRVFLADNVWLFANEGGSQRIICSASLWEACMQER